VEVSAVNWMEGRKTEKSEKGEPHSGLCSAVAAPVNSPHLPTTALATAGRSGGGVVLLILWTPLLSTFLFLIDIGPFTVPLGHSRTCSPK
jgi:hypothetical protein